MTTVVGLEGDGDDDEREGEEEWGRERAKTVAEADLNPATLIGSWFLRFDNGEVHDTGIVVAQVATGQRPQEVVYLVEYEPRAGDVKQQRLVSLASMLTDDDGYEWIFYDDEELMRTAYTAIALRSAREGVNEP